MPKSLNLERALYTPCFHRLDAEVLVFGEGTQYSLFPSTIDAKVPSVRESTLLSATEQINISSQNCVAVHLVTQFAGIYTVQYLDSWPVLHMLQFHPKHPAS
jgi:hypothetical protein